MALKQKIQTDLIAAVKKKDEIVRDTLRLLSAAILIKEKEKRYKINESQTSGIHFLRSFGNPSEQARSDFSRLLENKKKPEINEEELVEKSNLTDEEIIEVVFTEFKKRKEAISEFEKGERKDLAEKEKVEIQILKKYLPEQISSEKLEKIVEQAVEKTGAQEIKDIGKVMGELMPKIKGKADMGQVSKIVKELLSKQ